MASPCGRDIFKGCASEFGGAGQVSGPLSHLLAFKISKPDMEYLYICFSVAKIPFISGARFLIFPPYDRSLAQVLTGDADDEGTLFNLYQSNLTYAQPHLLPLICAP